MTYNKETADRMEAMVEAYKARQIQIDLEKKFNVRRYYFIKGNEHCSSYREAEYGSVPNRIVDVSWSSKLHKHIKPLAQVLGV